MERFYDCLGVNKAKAKKLQFETDMWCTLYYNFNDANKNHCMEAFESNGYDISSAEELHKVNLAFVKEVLKHNASKKYIVKVIPECKVFLDEMEGK